MPQALVNPHIFRRCKPPGGHHSSAFQHIFRSDSAFPDAIAARSWAGGDCEEKADIADRKPAIGQVIRRIVDAINAAAQTPGEALRRPASLPDDCHQDGQHDPSAFEQDARV
jgi:hypothetical protein